MNKIRYFDHSATTAVNEEVLKEMLPYFCVEYGNASSMYSISRNAKRALEIAATGSHNCLLCRCTRFGKKLIIRKNSYNFTRFNI